MKSLEVASCLTFWYFEKFFNKVCAIDVVIIEDDKDVWYYLLLNMLSHFITSYLHYRDFIWGDLFKKKLQKEWKWYHWALGGSKYHISGCGAFSLNSQSVCLLQAYLLLELLCSTLLAETSGKCPLVFGVSHLQGYKSCGQQRVIWAIASATFFTSKRL